MLQSDSSGLILFSSRKVCVIFLANIHFKFYYWSACFFLIKASGQNIELRVKFLISFDLIRKN